MADAPGNHRIQFVRDGIELIDIHVTQRFLLEETCTGFTLFTAGVVLAAHQGAFKVTVDDDDGDALRHGDRFAAQ